MRGPSLPRVGMLLAVWMAMTIANVAGAAAAPAASIVPDREIASVGDALTVRLQVDIGLALPIGGIDFTYVLPSTATYIPQSVVVNGTARADGGSVLVNADSVRVHISIARFGVNTVDLQARVVGSIGEAVVHRGAVAVNGAPTALYGPATWIEDQNATGAVPALMGDTFLSKAEPGFAFGATTSLVARTTSDRRPLLQFGYTGITIPSNFKVHASYLQFWPVVSSGAAMTLSAHRLRSTWTEGTQNGTPCVNGATWTTRNCINSWTAGGDYEGVPVGSVSVDAASRHAWIDIGTLAEAWITGARANQGLALIPTSAATNRSLTFPAREGVQGPVPAARQLVVIAPDHAYTDKAVSDCEAEIVPNTVVAGTSAQRFVYSLEANFSGGDTGLDRFTIAIPSGFSLVTLDSVRVAGAWLVRSTDAVLSSGEFEQWGSDSSLDVRFWPPLTNGSLTRRIDAVFRASVPLLPDSGREFLSVVDHDRRGFPPQNTKQGDSNGNSADDDSWRVVTVGGIVTGITVSPADTTVAAGQSIPYRAWATYSNQTVADVTSSAQWLVAPGTLGQFDAAPGVLRTQGQGNGGVTATFAGMTSTPATLRVGAPVLESVQVTPPSASVASGITTSYEADATFSDGSTLRVTSSAAWSVVDSTVAVVVSPGVVRGRAPGRTDIAALYAGRTGSAVIDVTPPQLIAIEVMPADTTVALGLAASLRATGTYTDGSQADVTSIATWVAVPAGLVDIDASGLATGIGVGTANVTASIGGIVSPAGRFTVAPAALQSIAIAPIDTTVALGRTVAYAAHGSFSDGSTQDLTAAVLWDALPGGIASFGANGVAQTVGEGQASIEAQLGGVTSPPALLRVDPAVVESLDGAPDAATVPLGSPHSVTSTAHYSNGASVDVTSQATWLSLEPAIADFVGPGDLQTLATGTARLVHSFAGVPGDTLRVTVTTASLDSVVVSPCGTMMPPGVERRFSATAHFSGGLQQDVTFQATWSSSAPGVATVAAGGVVTAIASGTTSLGATVLGVASAPCPLIVDPAAVTTLTVTPSDTTLAAGQSLQYTATGFAGTDVYDLTHLVLWSTADALIASIDPYGVATARSAGTTSVEAQFAALTGTATLHVTPASIVQIEVLPSLSTVRIGTTKGMTARATYSNRTTADITALASWTSTQPTIVHVESGGLARGLALGDAGITAAYASMTSSPATLTVLPVVQVEALAVGTQTVTPGTSPVALLALRFVNRYLSVRRITALRLAVDGPAAGMQLFADDGDGVFEPASDALLTSGTPAGGFWSATALTVDLAVGASRTLFAAAAVSMEDAVHGATLNAALPDVADVFWQTSSALVAPGPFPLDSAGDVRVQDLALAQIAFTPGVDSILTAGAGVPLFEMRLPANGPQADVLEHLELVQHGSARTPEDLAALRLQAWNGAWQAAGTLVPSGGDRWTATGLTVAVPPGGVLVRVVADIATGAATDPTVQIEMPVLACRFASNRRGPVDAGWTEPAAHRIESPRVLEVQGVEVATGAIVPRGGSPVPILGIDLLVRGVASDQLRTLRLDNATDGPSGAPADPNAEIGRVELWLDRDANGTVSAADSLLDATDPGSGVAFEFGTVTPLGLSLVANVQRRLLVTASADSTAARDGERLRLRFAGAATVASLAIDAHEPLAPLSPPIVDGQAADGYTVRPIGNTLVIAAARDIKLFDLALPSNGFEPDRLLRLRVNNLGTAQTSDLAEMRLHRDDGNGSFGPEDAVVATFAPDGARAWEAAGLDVALAPGVPARFFVIGDFDADAVVGRTFAGEIAMGDVEVASGNDGPNDRALVGGGPVIVTAHDEVLWVAGVAGDHVVRPDARQQVVLVLETLNAYSSPRTLRSLRVALRGTTATFEYDRWELYADANGNGLVDAEEAPLALGTLGDGALRFEGFDYRLDPFRQQRLLVAYSLAAGLSRDGSVIDAAIETAADFGYAPATGGTITTAQFEMNSAGQCEVDGHVASQIVNTPVVPQSLGGGETNVLLLDLILPSNGWEADVLNALQIDIAPTSATVELGTDLRALRLWREADADPTTARFEPAQDLLLESLLPGAPILRFDALSTLIPVGGRRFYVTADIAATPTNGRELQVLVPRDGIRVASGNDGPVDEAVVGTATHRISASTLLATIINSPTTPSVDRPVDVLLAVRNRGSNPVPVVVPLAVGLEPPLPYTMLAGPTPVEIALAPGAADTLRYQFTIHAPGTCHFTAVVGTPDSAIVSEPAAGPTLEVRRIATALQMEPRSGLPGVVSRGQTGTPLIWKLSLADSDDLAGAVEVRELQLMVETAAGAAQSAAAVFSRLEVRSAGVVRALLDPVPDVSLITLSLDPPLLVRPGEALDVPLDATIAGTATAASFALRIAASGAAAVQDVASGEAVPLQADLPWVSPVTSLRTVATGIDLELVPELAAGVNRGQDDVPLGTLRFVLPGAPGESEARVLQVVTAWQDSSGAALDPAALLRRLEIWSGASLLAGIDAPANAAGRITLPLAIPRSVVSGAPEDLQLRADLRTDAPLGVFAVAIDQPADVVVQDGLLGSTVAVALVPPATFPASLGTARVYEAARSVEVTAVSRLPAAAAAGAALHVADIGLRSSATPGTADLLLSGLHVRITDPEGTVLVPRTLVAGLEVRSAGAVVGAATVLPSSAVAVTIPFTTPLRFAAGEPLDLVLHADLAAAPAVAALRFALEGTAFDIADANDPEQLIVASGTLPFATNALQIVVAPAAVELGPLEDPPANVVVGQQGAAMGQLRVRHPGAVNEAPIAPRALVVTLVDVAGRPFAATGIVTAARLRGADATLAAVVGGDSLTFDLSSWPRLDPGTVIDATLEFDVQPAPASVDFGLALGTTALDAVAGASRLPVRALAGEALPWRSPTVHIGAADLATSFVNYPNPFAAGQQSTRIPFFLQAAARVTVDVWTLTGERVIRLLDGATRSAGLHDDLEWNGRNGRGEIVRNGTYVLAIEVEGPAGGKARRKLAVLR